MRPPPVPATPNAPPAAGVEVSRELDKLRDMEAAVAKREAELAQTIDAYKRAADDWRGTCGAGTTIIQQAPDVPVKGHVHQGRRRRRADPRARDDEPQGAARG